MLSTWLSDHERMPEISFVLLAKLLKHLWLWEEVTFFGNSEENSALGRDITDQSHWKEHRTWQEIVGNMFIMKHNWIWALVDELEGKGFSDMNSAYIASVFLT